MQVSIYPSYHMVGPNLVLDVPVSGSTPVPTYVSASLAPALFVEEAFPDHFAYTCVLYSDSHLRPSSDSDPELSIGALFESYVQAAATEIGKHVKFRSFPFSSKDGAATVCFAVTDVTVGKDGATAIPFYLMLRPTKEVFEQAVGIIDMQASALAGARAAGVLTSPSLAELLSSTPSVAH